MKNKILIFTVVSIIVISLFVVPCFALEDVIFGDGDTFEFVDTLDLSMFSQGTTESNYGFICDGILYTGFYVSYRGYYVLSYSTGDSLVPNVDVYKEGEGWVNDFYKTITFQDGAAFNGVWAEFLTANEFENKFSVYGTIYSLISEYLFAGHMEESFVQLAVTLLSVILTMVVFVFPFGVVYMVFKFILTAIDRSI